jgi:hypothetical protein
MDLDLLKGIWRALRIETGGGPVPVEIAATVRYIFEGDHARLMEGDQPAGEGSSAWTRRRPPRRSTSPPPPARRRARRRGGSTGSRGTGS